MSAFIVEDKTINRIVNSLAGYYIGQQIGLIYPLMELGYDLCKFEEQERLAKAMFELNCNSVHQRYPHDKLESFRPLNFQFEVNDYGDSKFQLVSSLACFLYQSCEGDCDKTDLFKALQMIKGHICYSIVRSMPEFMNLEWG